MSGHAQVVFWPFAHFAANADLSLLGAKQTLRVRMVFLFPASRHLTAVFRAEV